MSYKTGKNIVCKNCRKEFYVSGCRLSTKFYCSKNCYTKKMIGRFAWNKGKKLPQFTGKNSGAWKGGKIVHTKKYILIRNIEHPFAYKYHGYIFEHRFVAEKYLGRYLTSKERIHHINGIKNDNRPENLYLFPSIGQHWKFHLLKNKSILESNLIST